MWLKTLIALSMMIRFETFALGLFDVQKNIFVATKRAPVDENHVRVSLSREPCYTIYSYFENDTAARLDDEFDDDGDRIRSASRKFYTCMCCNFADQILSELLDIVKRFPAVYASDLSAYRTFEDVRDDDFERAARRAERFANVLFDYVLLDTYASLVETDALKSLLSLRFKIDFIRASYALGNGGNDIDRVVIAAVLESANEFQNFMALHCEMNRFDDNSTFYGFVRSDAARHYSSAAGASFLRNVRELGFEKPQERCDAGRMLLERVLRGEKNNAVSEELCRVNVTLSDGNAANVEEIYEKVTLDASVEVKFWFQRIIFAAVVKLVCVKMLKAITTASVLHGEINKAFRLLLKYFFVDFTRLPAGLMYSFRVFAEKRQISSGDRATVTKYVKRHVESRRSDGRDSPWPGFEITTDGGASELGLEDFVLAMVDDLDEYKCFARLFGFLSNEYDGRYYFVHDRNPEKVREFVRRELSREQGAVAAGKDEATKTRRSPYTKERIVDEVCKLCVRVCQLCHETLLLIDNARQMQEDAECVSRELEEIGGNIFSVGSYLKSLARYRYDRAFNRLALNAVAVMAVPGNGIWENAEYDNLSRLMLAVMSELNAAAAQYCQPPAYRYLLFNNVDLSRTGSHKRFFTDSADFWMGYCGGTRQVAYDVPHVRPWFEFYRERSEYFGAYTNVAKFSWKGERMTVGDVLRELRSSVSSPMYVHATFDLYYKHAVAAIHHETAVMARDIVAWRVANHPRPDRVEDDRWWLPTNYNQQLVQSDFPGPFKKYVYCYGVVLTDFFRRAYCSRNKPDHTEASFRELNRELTKLGVFVDEEVRSASDRPAVTDPSVYLERFFKTVAGIVDTVRPMKKFYENIKKYDAISTETTP